jgi:cell division protease FtsH
VEGNFLGAEAQQKAISDETRKQIDLTVRTMLQEAYATATRLITTHKALHEQIATDLLAREEMDEAEFDAYFTDVAGVPAKIAM